MKTVSHAPWRVVECSFGGALTLFATQAIMLGDPEIVDCLLAGGADPRIETPRGYPLTIAASLVRQ